MKQGRHLAKPNGKENLTPKGWYNKWHAYLYGDALAKQGVKYQNVFLDDFEKMGTVKKHVDAVKKDRKRLLSKKDKDGKGNINVTEPVGDGSSQLDPRSEIHVGGQLGYPQESVSNRDLKTYKEFISGIDR